MRGPINDTEIIRNMPRNATENACPHTSSQSDTTSGKTGCSQMDDAMMLNTVPHRDVQKLWVMFFTSFRHLELTIM